MILHEYAQQHFLINTDYIIIYSATAEKHLEYEEKVLDLQQGSGFSLKYAKCFFFEYVVLSLGHILKPGRLEIDDAHIATLPQAKLPRTLTDLRFFPSFVKVYHRFVLSFTRTARPPYDLIRV